MARSCRDRASQFKLCRQYRATVIVRYVDNQGRPPKQLEVCDGHADLIIRREQRDGASERDLRG
jgi:hypothetical protein